MLRLFHGKAIQANETGCYPVYGSNGEIGRCDSGLYNNAIIIGRVGAYCGSVAREKCTFWASDNTIVCRAVDDVADTDFCYYLLKDLRLNNYAGGTAQPLITQGIIKRIQISLPSLPVQRRIADILSAYDDLIENNRRRIAILEEAARLAYRKWFGGAEQGRTAMLGEIAPFVRGKVITQKNAVHGKVPVVAGGLDPAYSHNVANTGVPVITISGSGANAGFTRMYFEPIWASDCSWCDKSKTKYFYFSYCFLKDNADALRNLQQGAAQPHVYPKDINALEVALPKSDDLLDNFEESVEPLFSQCGVLAKQNTALVTARDMLLPRLMKGDLMRLDMSDTDTTRCESRVQIPPFPNRGCVSDFGGAL
jgi:type I restriction enzyme S subunit